LIDTFVIRPLLVPSLMHILGRLNYWVRPLCAVSNSAL